MKSLIKTGLPYLLLFSCATAYLPASAADRKPKHKTFPQKATKRSQARAQPTLQDVATAKHHEAEAKTAAASALRMESFYYKMMHGRTSDRYKNTSTSSDAEKETKTREASVVVAAKTQESDAKKTAAKVTLQRSREYKNGHRHEISALAPAYDGIRLLSGSEDNTVKLWNITTGDCTATFSGHKGEIAYLKWFSSGKKFGSISKDGTIKLWDVETQKNFCTIAGIKIYSYNAVDWHKDALLAVGNYDGSIPLFNLNDEEALLKGKPLTRIQDLEAPISSVKFSTDCQMLAATSVDNMFGLWDMSAPSHPKMLAKGTTNFVDPAFQLQFSLDDQLLAVTESTKIRVWNMKNKQDILCIRTLKENLGSISSMCWHPNNIQLAVASTGKTIVVYDIKAKTRHLIRSSTYHARVLRWSRDGKRLIAGMSDGNIRIFPVPIATDDPAPVTTSSSSSAAPDKNSE